MIKFQMKSPLPPIQQKKVRMRFRSDSKLKISAKQAQEAKASVAYPDAWGRLIGPQNIAPIKIDGEETMVLLDGGAQISTIS